MVVLFTNIGFSRRTGTEVLTADLARSLKLRGHTPVIYSPSLGEVAAEIRALGIQVVSSLDQVSVTPDLIHGHHHLEVVQAIQAFPNTPALFVCHDVTAWHDQVPRHPNIVSFVAVGLNARKRLMRDWSRTRGFIDVIGNGVDTSRFLRSARLSPEPRRALVFSNDAGDGSHWEPIVEACRRVHLPVDRIGRASSNQDSEPEKRLGNYDIVFAKGRCALEAAAVGCAVVLCDIQGLGVMITARHVEKLLAWNFGMRTLHRNVDPALIEHEIRCYNPRDAARVCDYIRGHATLDAAVNRYLEVYRRTVQQGVPRSAEASVLKRYPVTRRIQPQDQAQIRIKIVAPPPQASPGKPVALRVKLTNRSGAPLATSPPWPALLFHRWYEAGSRQPLPLETPRAILQPPLQPGACHEYPLRAIAPWKPGRYRCAVTIIQEGWRWLDELAPRVSAACDILVA